MLSSDTSTTGSVVVFVINCEPQETVLVRYQAFKFKTINKQSPSICIIQRTVINTVLKQEKGRKKARKERRQSPCFWVSAQRKCLVTTQTRIASCEQLLNELIVFSEQQLRKSVGKPVSEMNLMCHAALMGGFSTLPRS